MTAAHAKKRIRLTKRFLSHFPFNKNMKIQELYHWVSKHKWSERTKISYFATIKVNLERRGVHWDGDVVGALRQLRLHAMENPPTRVLPITVQELISKTRKLPADMEAITIMAWAFGARLTSIQAIRRTDMKFQQWNSHMAEISITFRKGKTILATGPYTVTTLIPIKIANWIMTQENQVFQKEVGVYYNVIRKALKPYAIRSLRKGALQALAKRNIDPTTLMLFSRHKTMQSLYAYLDDGMACNWEKVKTEIVAPILWT